MQIWFLGQEDPLEKEMATHSGILVWEIPWTEEPVGLQSTGSQRVRHDLVTEQQVARFAWCMFYLSPKNWGWVTSHNGPKREGSF